ncbi:MAG: hypothetical protein ACRBBN_11145 [Methyloligellaceae bacterium]
MTNSSLARTFLGLNATFSVISGLAFLIAGEMISQIIFSQPDFWKILIVRGIGVGLLLFAADLAIQARNEQVTRQKIILFCIQDLAWIIFSAVMILGFGWLFTPNGILAIDVVAVIVAILAIGQFIGVRRMAASEKQVA